MDQFESGARVTLQAGNSYGSWETVPFTSPVIIDHGDLAVTLSMSVEPNRSSLEFIGSGEVIEESSASSGPVVLLTTASWASSACNGHANWQTPLVSPSAFSWSTYFPANSGLGLCIQNTLNNNPLEVNLSTFDGKQVTIWGNAATNVLTIHCDVNKLSSSTYLVFGVKLEVRFDFGTNSTGNSLELGGLEFQDQVTVVGLGNASLTVDTYGSTTGILSSLQLKTLTVRENLTIIGNGQGSDFPEIKWGQKDAAEKYLLNCIPQAATTLTFSKGYVDFGGVQIALVDGVKLSIPATANLALTLKCDGGLTLSDLPAVDITIRSGSAQSIVFEGEWPTAQSGDALINVHSVFTASNYYPIVDVTLCGIVPMAVEMPNIVANANSRISFEANANNVGITGSYRVYGTSVGTLTPTFTANSSLTGRVAIKLESNYIYVPSGSQTFVLCDASDPRMDITFGRIDVYRPDIAMNPEIVTMSISLAMSPESVSSVSFDGSFSYLRLDGSISIIPTFSGVHDDSYYHTLLSQDWTVIQGPYLILSDVFDWNIVYPDGGSFGFANGFSALELKFEAPSRSFGARSHVLLKKTANPSEIPYDLCYSEFLYAVECDDSYVIVDMEESEELAALGTIVPSDIKNLIFNFADPVEAGGYVNLSSGDNFSGVAVTIKSRDNITVPLALDTSILASLTLSTVVISSWNGESTQLVLNAPTLSMTKATFAETVSASIGSETAIFTDLESIIPFKLRSHAKSFGVHGLTEIIFYSNRWTFIAGDLQLEISPTDFPGIWVEARESLKLTVGTEESKHLSTTLKDTGIAGLNITTGAEGVSYTFSDGWDGVNTSGLSIDMNGYTVEVESSGSLRPDVFTGDGQTEETVAAIDGPLTLPETLVISSSAHTYDVSGYTSNKYVKGSNVVVSGQSSFYVTGGEIIVENVTLEANAVLETSDIVIHQGLNMGLDSEISGEVDLSGAVVEFHWNETKFPYLSIGDVTTVPAEFRVIFDGPADIDFDTYNSLLYLNIWEIVSGTSIDCDQWESIFAFESESPYFGTQSVLDIMCTGGSISIYCARQLSLPEPTPTKEHDNKAAVIICIVLACVFVVVLVVFLVVWFAYKKRVNARLSEIAMLESNNKAEQV